MSWVEEEVKSGVNAVNSKNPQWIEEDVNIPNQTVLDDDTGVLYSAPITFDEADIRFAIETQHKQKPKNNFIGKVEAIGNNAIDFSTELAGKVEKGFLNLERGALGFTGQAADTFLHASLSLPEKIQKLEAAERGDFSEWDESLNGRITDEDIANAPDDITKSALIHKKYMQDKIIAERKQKVEQVQNIRRKLDKSIKKWQEILRPEAEQSDTEKLIEMLGSGSASLGLSILTLLATKNPQISAGLLAGTFGRMRYTDVFDKSIAQGYDYDEANRVCS